MVRKFGEGGLYAPYMRVGRGVIEGFVPNIGIGWWECTVGVHSGPTCHILCSCLKITINDINITKCSLINN